MALKLELQTSQILTNDDEVCIPNLSSIFSAVHTPIPSLFATVEFYANIDTNNLKLALKHDMDEE